MSDECDHFQDALDNDWDAEDLDDDCCPECKGAGTVREMDDVFPCPYCQY